MDALAKEYDVVAKRQRILAHSTMSTIDHLIDSVNECKSRCGSPTRGASGEGGKRGSDSEGAAGSLKRLVTHAKDEQERSE